MPAQKIRTDYDMLERIARSFMKQADLTAQSWQSLRNNMKTLQDGDWIGEGARKFYAEMTTYVKPSVRRLAGALEESTQVTKQIQKIMQQAEEDAARLFGERISFTALLAAGILGPFAAAAAAALAAGEQAGGNGSAAVDKMLSKFDPKVRELIKKSPSLLRQFEKMNGKWTIKHGPPGGDKTYADIDNNVIVIQQGMSINDQVNSIAHEVGHATYGEIPYHKPTTGMTRKEYLRLNVQEDMRDEGNAQLNAATARDEIRKGGGPDIGMPGSQPAAYQSVYNNYKNGNITRSQAIDQMGNLMGNEVPTGSTKKYRDYYSPYYENKWKEEVGSGRTKK